MKPKAKIIVLDANIILRAVLGIRTFSLIAKHRDNVLFVTPETCYYEVAFHIPNIARKRHISPVQEQEALEILDALKQLVTEIDQSIYEDFKQDALNRIGDRDKKDWSIVALALAFNCPIWTEDQDFFGLGMATWRTKNISIFFNQ